MRFAVCLLGAEIFAVEFSTGDEIEEPEGEGKLTTSDHSFGFGTEPFSEYYYDDEEKA